MKSQVIRKRNLPEGMFVNARVQLKPTVFLALMVMAGTLFVAARPYLVLSGIMMVMLGAFCLFVMPEGVLCEFTKEYLILYNRRSSSECMMIYWEDIVSWQYEWHPNADYLIIMLVDGSTESQEVYSKSIRRLMNTYAPGKEIKPRAKRLG